jgi:hypothetical protein
VLRRARPWRTLALVSADGAPVAALANRLALMASVTPNRHVLVIDAVPRPPGTLIPLPAGHHGVKAMREGMSDSDILGIFVPEAAEALANDAFDIVLLAAPSPAVHAHALPLIAAADVSVLCVALDASRLRIARETMKHFEPDRLLGTVLIGGD